LGAYFWTMAAVAPSGAAGKAAGEWRSGLGDCFQECGTCSYSCCCPACASASAKTNFDGSNWCFNCLCVPTGVTQSIIRDGYKIEGGCLGDASATVCCCIQPCAVTRMLREVKTRGPCSSKTTITATGQLVRVCDNVKTKPWSSGLFSCHQNCGHCLNSFCCPCCAIATARTAYDDSSWAFNCCCLGPCATRNIIREGKFNIEGDCLGDMCVGCCCIPCSSAQLLRELDHRKANTAEIKDPVVAPGQKSSQKAPSKKSSRRGSRNVS